MVAILAPALPKKYPPRYHVRCDCGREYIVTGFKKALRKQKTCRACAKPRRKK